MADFRQLDFYNLQGETGALDPYAISLLGIRLIGILDRVNPFLRQSCIQSQSPAYTRHRLAFDNVIRYRVQKMTTNASMHI